MINIRFATLDDIDRVMEFYKIYWDENHILANNRRLMEFQHVEDGEFHYVIAEEDGKICGATGFIKMNHSENPDIASTMLRTIKSSCDFLGWELHEFLEKETKCLHHCGLGINPRTAGIIAQHREAKINKLKQYYRLSNRNEYVISKISNKIILTPSGEKGKLISVNGYNEIDHLLKEEILRKKVYYKDKKYLRHRYFEHPFYQYLAWKICKNNKETGSVLIGREIEQNEGIILRIVEFIGEDRDLIGISSSLDQLMDKRGYEYIDFYCYGIQDKIMQQAGFVHRSEKDENIIPNHFEPFEQKNVEIYFTKELDKAAHIYKGDSDQDRPNLI